MQIEASTFLNTSFLGPSQETSLLQKRPEKDWFRLTFWQCGSAHSRSGHFCWMASFSTILKFWLPVPSSPTCLSAIPQGLQHFFSISCHENSSPEGVTLSSCYLRCLETRAMSQPILTCGMTEASLCPSGESWAKSGIGWV